MQLIRESIIDILADSDIWLLWFWTAAKIVLIFVLARVAIKVLGKTVQHIAVEKDKLRFNPRRTKTIVRLMGNIVKYAINFVMVLMILGELGVPYGPMLAGAGVLGLAIGFGAQSLVKDVITGFFIIFEDQFAIGDMVQIGAYKGTVEEIGLRVTRVKSWTGEVHIIPNGSIVQVTNFTLDNTIAVLDVALAYETDVELAIERMKRAVKRLGGEPLEAAPEVLGLQTVGGGAVVIRVVCPCKANRQPDAVRVVNAALKKELDTGGMKIVAISSQVP